MERKHEPVSQQAIAAAAQLIALENGDLARACRTASDALLWLQRLDQSYQPTSGDLSRAILLLHGTLTERLNEQAKDAELRDIAARMDRAKLEATVPSASALAGLAAAEGGN